MQDVKEESTHSSDEIIPCLSGFELIHKRKFKFYLYEIKNLVSCPTEFFRKYYLSTLCNLAEFCQAMPFSENEFNYSYGFFLRQLKLAIAVLKYRRGVLLPRYGGAEDISTEEALWTYAIFSGSLLKNLYQLQTNREVQRYQLHGDSIGVWSPMAGSLYRKSSYYTMRIFPEKSMLNVDVLLAALSGHIIPNDGISWLYGNKNLFKQWWDVVVHQMTSSNDIETIIQFAGKKAGIIS